MLPAGIAGVGIGTLAIYASGGSWALMAAGIFLGVVGALLFGVYEYNIGSAMAERREHAAGYTTLPLPHMPELELVEPQTGVVIRPVGGAALTMEEYRARVSEIRESARATRG